MSEQHKHVENTRVEPIKCRCIYLDSSIIDTVHFSEIYLISVSRGPIDSYQLALITVRRCK